ncbi:hypothetical protein GGS21DRAFT_493913 [Xylaria nigripes]|nr:hypothetical protein GGS21DRAFT_493913 [Xylaria nigripes]
MPGILPPSVRRKFAAARTKMTGNINEVTNESTSRRDSTATDITLVDNTKEVAYRTIEVACEEEELEDDQKTLSNFTPNEGSSDEGRKLKKIQKKPSTSLKKKKKPLPPDYYPNNLITLEAVATLKSRVLSGAQSGFGTGATW